MKITKKQIIIVASILIVILSIYLLIQYNKMNNTTLRLIGNETIYLATSDTWEDPGCKVIYNDKVLDKSVKKIDKVDYKTVGIYKIEYTVNFGIFSKKIARKVIITPDGNFNIKLKGLDPYYILKGNPFKEPGYTAIDGTDGDISSRVIIVGNVNTNIVGEYNLEYSVKNSSGITKKVTRKVVVYDFKYEASINKEGYAKEKEIKIKINDSNYKHTVLPDEDVTTTRDITFKVTENGQYKFYFYDKNNNIILYETNITDIDNIKPTGSCTLNLYDKSGEINVLANDNQEIKGYIYHYGKNKTDLVKEKKYSFSTMDDIASVDIYDVANNITNVECKINDKSTIQPRSYTYKTYLASNGRNQGYWHYIPSGSVRKKLTLLVYLHGAGSYDHYNDVNKYAFPLFVKNGTNFPYMMIAPHCNGSCSFANDTVIGAILEVIDYAIKNYNVDPDRIIISGGSAGTIGASKILNNYGSRFAGMLIVSGYYDYFTMPKNYIKKPMLFIQGKYDSYQKATDIVNKINSLGGNATLSGVNGGHDISERVLANKEYTDWIINQKRK